MRRSEGGSRPARGLGPHSNAEHLARGLGWFSIALGAAEIVAPGAVGRLIGLRNSETLIRAYGVREVVNGVAILASHDPTPWVAARVAGDALDLATLGTAYGEADDEDRDNLVFAMAAVSGVAALDMACASALSGEKRLGTTMVDYSDRSGFPQGTAAARGAAVGYAAPEDFRIPEALRPLDA